MRFSDPEWLLLILALPWYLAHRRRIPPSLVIVRSTFVLCLALGIAGAQVRGGDSPVSVAFVIDSSSSVPIREQRRALVTSQQMAAPMRRGDRVAVVLFGRDAVVDQPMAEHGPQLDVSSSVRADETNIETALRVARSALPKTGVRRIVLLSDGRDTAGDPLREAASAAADGIRIDAIPQLGASGIQVERLVAPPHVRVGEPYVVEVEVSGAPGASGAVTIRRDDKVLESTTAAIDRFGAGQLTFTDRSMTAGWVVYTAGTAEAASEAGAVLTVAAAPQVLYASTGEDRHIERLLGPGQFHTVTTHANELPSNSSHLAPFAAVVLDGVAADDLTADQNRALAAFADAGGGLLVLGTSRSIGPNGYPGTPIGEALPVDLRRRSGSRTSAVAFVVLMDKSGSMADQVGGITKIELARRSVLSLLRTVRPTDPVGVIAFDTAAAPVATLAANASEWRLSEQLRAVTPSGSTAIAPAAQIGLQWLRASGVARQELLLLSDGRSNPADIARLMALARDHDVEWAIVAIGSDADRQTFKQLAEMNGGHLYLPDDVRALPDVVAREGARALGDWRIEERVSLHAVGSHPVLNGINSDEIPPLDGYVIAGLKKGANAILLSQRNDPVLAAWNFGLGRTAIFTADTSPAFRAWPDAGRLWRQTVRWLGRSAEPTRLRVNVEESARGPHLIADVRTASGNYANGLIGEAIVRDQEHKTRTVGLEQIAPGQYGADLSADKPGPYFVNVFLKDAATREEVRELTGVFWSGSAERFVGAPDVARLREIAQAGGGGMLSSGDSLFSSDRPPSYRSISAALTFAAFLCYALEFAMRRGLIRTRLLDRWLERVGTLARHQLVES